MQNEKNKIKLLVTEKMNVMVYELYLKNTKQREAKGAGVFVILD